MFRKRLLPEAHTDFIFAITLEELGIIGGLAILGLLMFMIARIILVGVRSKKPFNSLMYWNWYNVINSSLY